MRLTSKVDFTGNDYKDFFNKFSYWTDADPTKGFVNYVDQDSAWQNGLIGNGRNIYIGVDHTSVAPQHGRKSVRMTSKSAFNPGTLIVADISHMHIVIDTTLCGNWADGTWASSGCAASTGFKTCEDYVKNKPEDFRSAFWTFKSLRVFV
ncbi:hypothetical protein KCU64_g1535, partial [Aureobasidium melanogenum]